MYEDVTDVGMVVEYTQYFLTHRFPRFTGTREMISALEEVDDDYQGRGDRGGRRGRGRRGGRIIVGGVVGYGQGGGGGQAGGGYEGGVVRGRGGVVRGRGGRWRMGGIGWSGPLQAENVASMGVKEGSHSDGSNEEIGDYSDEDTESEVVGGGVGFMGLEGIAVEYEDLHDEY
ncbi:uncharacterized protein LOC131075708 [Cryptomeria japonica]|uniref:uncharacterized protein LOC131075708 n=1 Tax=Cryptomeria japonica TaxID=3369 RepID=UPI0025AD7BC7|nr:uncharacterized protein LOC131075708 [Cryptomeria japonica]